MKELKEFCKCVTFFVHLYALFQFSFKVIVKAVPIPGFDPHLYPHFPFIGPSPYHQVGIGNQIGIGGQLFLPHTQGQIYNTWIPQQFPQQFNNVNANFTNQGQRAEVTPTNVPSLRTLPISQPQRQKEVKKTSSAGAKGKNQSFINQQRFTSAGFSPYRLPSPPQTGVDGPQLFDTNNGIGNNERPGQFNQFQQSLQTPHINSNRNVHNPNRMQKVSKMSEIEMMDLGEFPIPNRNLAPPIINRNFNWPQPFGWGWDNYLLNQDWGWDDNGGGGVRNDTFIPSNRPAVAGRKPTKSPITPSPELNYQIPDRNINPVTNLPFGSNPNALLSVGNMTLTFNPSQSNIKPTNDLVTKLHRLILKIRELTRQELQDKS